MHKPGSSNEGYSILAINVAILLHVNDSMLINPVLNDVL